MFITFPVKAIIAFTVLSTLNVSIPAFTIFFTTKCFFTIASFSVCLFCYWFGHTFRPTFFHLCYCIYFWSKSLRIFIYCIFNGIFSLLSIYRFILTFYTLTRGSTLLIICKAFTIKFEAFWFFTMTFISGILFLDSFFIFIFRYNVVYFR